jgi:apolipoprotein D and lipocalin family protein
LGTWYEIARLPNSFEKNLDHVTAIYTLRDDGKINVLNKGFDSAKKYWKEATGKAWIPNSRIPAHLRVSFFWIFAGDYKIIALDGENYSYSMVTSKTKKYLWILSRTPRMDNEVYNKLVEKAKGFGFEVEELYKVSQS